MEAKEILKNNCIKITKSRINILKILMENEDSISVEYIFEKCKKNHVTINLSTVYRTLDLFEIKGIVSKFDLGSGRYNYIIKEQNHKHKLECKICHKEIEIDCPMQQIQELIKNKTGFTIMDNEINLKLKGICKDCKVKNK
ncbi:ferric uptake regulation protein [Clostridium acetireducens DSM 10703]|jgi:Fur family ferric uptake transcriptional regulator|uniref:Ferric uptake regulation protein n=1 Tax=Clostridium acetireducens DSM 10703 TaxID=1121290 RepID=A0A1E8EYX4_9CLOT|nr:Fur family transcriptional regulator [Clostridium acetireducens]OFI05877.1 ferric uptake regulation protein [Clostridium acetireducens DSM 10703]